jgi:hypothetical protein
MPEASHWGASGLSADPNLDRFDMLAEVVRPSLELEAH